MHAVISIFWFSIVAFAAAHTFDLAIMGKALDVANNRRLVSSTRKSPCSRQAATRAMCTCAIWPCHYIKRRSVPFEDYSPHPIVMVSQTPHSDTENQVTPPASAPHQTMRIAIPGVDGDISLTHYPIEGCQFPNLPHDTLAARAPTLQRSEELPFWQWKLWGTDDFLFESALCFDCYSNTLDPQTGEPMRFMLKMILRRERGSRRMPGIMAKRLEHEAEFYVTHLTEYQGNCVPIYYGLWTAETTWGGSVMCSIMEHAGEPYCLKEKYDTQKNRDVIAELVLNFHRHSLLHRQLSEPYITWHVLWDATKGCPRLIDFTHAAGNFSCRRSLPLCRYASSPTEEIFCSELVFVGLYLGFFGRKKVDDDEEVLEALDVLEKYEEKHWGREGYDVEEGLAMQEQWIKQRRLEKKAAAKTIKTGAGNS
ncbi:hypothetical protein Hypma_016420 [Hypsizygus marmoreus]|uniref:Protein kinase domain-containing protein n=1 Tax=Hypsizygus marmoreus TaxID=39966 RepID=A0A369J0G0_HYPMA|nr:hypothetical protein Hypma_016420 [Hypsizygus marmoreus]